MSDPSDSGALKIALDRSSSAPVGEQIYASLRRAILSGALPAGGRLPSGRDLAIQLGVARGTIRSAYDRLAAEDLVFGAGPAGTRIKGQLPPPSPDLDAPLDTPLARFNRPYSSAPLPFQMGVPANDAFPAKTWSRLRSYAVRADALGFTTYADPRGELELRSQIASHLAVSRQIQCHPDQVIVTSGYRQGLMLSLTALEAHGCKAWLEEPGYPLARRALEMAGLIVQPIPVDAEGLRVEEGMTYAPEAIVALVSPGQQAPLGMPLAAARRAALLAWADAQKSWIIEDDYLGELQIDGRAMPALAEGIGAERVIHIGAFSKTMSPALGLGYVVAPPSLAERMVEVAAILSPAPNRTTQLALGEFLGSGHFLRHLRQMKTLYRERRTHTIEHLGASLPRLETSGLGLVAYLPKTINDVALAHAARQRGLAPSALSPWHMRQDNAPRGLLMSITNLRPDNIKTACDELATLVARAGGLA